MNDTRTLVIGAGVIGAAIALDLQKRGRAVTLIDREAPGMGASFGNMASIAVTEFMPASRPSVWRQIPGWLLDPEGPIAVRPSHVPRLIPWFWRFLRASRPGVLHALESQGAALCLRALADTQALLRDLGAEDQITATGCLSLYADDAEFHADREHIALLDRFGLAHRLLDGAALRDLEPAITPAIARAVLFPDNRSLKDPLTYVQSIVARFQALGGQVVRDEVTGFVCSERLQAVRLARGGLMAADEAVLCAGAFSGRLTAMLGQPIPLETERGYHTQIMAPGVNLAHSIIWPARAFMVTPTAGGLRIGGTVEMAGLDAPPNWNRAKVTVRRAREALPGLQVQGASEWMGHRPALPDTVPILSAARVPGVFVATGHGHLGLTNAATTAVLMGQLIAGERPEIDLQPYRLDRF